jgi:hypothetical protein
MLNYLGGIQTAALFAVVVVIVLLGLWFMLRYYTAHYLLKLSLQIENPQVVRGDTLKFKIGINSSSNITVTRIIMKLKCVQTVHDQGQVAGDIASTLLFSSSYSSRSILDDAPETLQEYQWEAAGGSLTFQKGQAREIPAEIPIPGDAIHSKEGGRLWTQWNLVIEAHLPAPDPPGVITQKIRIVPDYQAHLSSLPQYQDAQDDPFHPKIPAQPQIPQAQTSGIPQSLFPSQTTISHVSMPPQNSVQQPAPLSGLELPPDPPQNQQPGGPISHLEFEDEGNQS